MPEAIRAAACLLLLVCALTGASARALPAAGDADYTALVQDAWHGAPAVAAAAREALASAAAAGNAAAAHTLATLHYAGIGTAVDRAAALHWWQRAAEGGHADAAFNAGLLLLANPATKTDALHLFEQAAANEHALACYALGTWLAQHAGAAADIRRHLECAARQGYAPAQHNLGQWLAQAGEDTEARRWLAAAAPGFAPSATALAALPPATAQVDEKPALPATAAAIGTPEPAAPHIHDRDWVLTQAPSSYTVLVSAAAHAEPLRALLQAHVAEQDCAWFLHRPRARQAYTAIVGVFPDQAQAAQALAALPAALQRNQPWIRRFGDLQRELQAAAASTDQATTGTP